MKKILVSLAALSLTAGLAGFAQADETEVDGVGTLHYGVTDDGEAYLVGEGDGDNTPDGYVGVESDDGIVAACNNADGIDNTDDDSYTAGEGVALDATGTPEQPECIG